MGFVMVKKRFHKHAWILLAFIGFMDLVLKPKLATVGFVRRSIALAMLLLLLSSPPVLSPPRLTNAQSGPLLVSAITAYPSTVAVGDVASFKVTATGGTEPYSYSWIELPSGCNPASDPLVVCTPSEAGKYDISVKVTDARGDTVTSPSITFVVTSASVVQEVSYTGIVTIQQSMLILGGNPNPNLWKQGACPEGNGIPPDQPHLPNYCWAFQLYVSGIGRFNLTIAGSTVVWFVANLTGSWQESVVPPCSGVASGTFNESLVSAHYRELVLASNNGLALNVTGSPYPMGNTGTLPFSSKTKSTTGITCSSPNDPGALSGLWGEVGWGVIFPINPPLEQSAIIANNIGASIESPATWNNFDGYGQYQMTLIFKTTDTSATQAPTSTTTTGQGVTVTGPTPGSTSSQTSQISNGGGGIPEFPAVGLAVATLTILIGLGYLMMRRKLLPPS